MNTRAASASQRMVLQSNADNMDAISQAKAHLQQRPQTAHALQRNTLGDIGNKVSAIQITDGNKKGPIKKEIVQINTRPQKALTKAKATSSLRALAEEPTKPVVYDDFQFVEPSKTSTVPTATVHPLPSGPAPMDISDAGPEAFSKALLNVQDIDANDKENPQLVSEYVNEIYEYMRMLETRFPVRQGYLDQQEITGKMRAILIDWLCQVHHRFHLLQETLYLTVSIIDRFLQERPVSKNKLQLVGVTSMLIASKYEEMYAPEVADFVYITDNAYTKKEILEMEQTIIRALNFSFGKPLCLHFLRRNSKAGQVDASKHTLAKYLMELTIVEYDMVQYLPSQIAAASLCLSMKLLDGGKWTETLDHYSSFTEEDLLPTMQKLATLVIKQEDPKLKLTAIKLKYSSSKFMKISSIAALKSPLVQELASNSS
ncbi:G2/mitotic-specific cyclin-B-like [Mya arenaria]|uniref:G2/mitotic-specific cyclin-B-like n=1 Tax=Mya arenaria TaxID=6604 RepID=UPI0022E7E4A8|nr:G2/mitotic-specific cyclin-B-like [Mya arenaria]